MVLQDETWSLDKVLQTASLILSIEGWGGEAAPRSNYLVAENHHRCPCCGADRSLPFLAEFRALSQQHGLLSGTIRNPLTTELYK